MLSQAGLEVQERDIFREPLSEEEGRALLALRPADELFSWRSPTARRLGVSPGAPEDELASLMALEPRLIRRPALLVGGRLLLGREVEEWLRDR